MSLISILVPTYNRREYLQACLDSLLATTVPCEIIVGDNASTDGTEAMMAGYTDARIRYVRHAENLGLVGNHNYLLAAAAGTYVCLFGDDDLALPGCFELKVALLEAHPQIGGVFSSLRVVNADGLMLAPFPVYGRPDISYLGGRDDVAHLLVNCSISWQALVFRRRLYDEVGPLRDYDGMQAQDWDWLIGLARRQALAFINEPTVAVRVHPHSLTKSLHQARTGPNSAISLWRRWLLETPDPPVVTEMVWHAMTQTLTALVRAAFGTDEGIVDHYQLQLQEVRQAYRQLMEVRFGREVRQLLPMSQDRDAEGLPVFRDGLSPLPIGPRRGVVFFHPVDWRQERWRGVMAGYAGAFTDSDDVELLVWLDPAQGVDPVQGAQWLWAEMAAAVTDTERLPELSLMTGPLSLAEQARLYAAVHVAVAAGDPVVLHRASRASPFVLNRVDAPAWQEARRHCPAGD
jgi:hypothetical protein